MWPLNAVAVNINTHKLHKANGKKKKKRREKRKGKKKRINFQPKQIKMFNA